MAPVYFFLGFIITVIAAAPPGAANIVVMNTVTRKSLRMAMTVVVGAGFGEVLLSFIALHCTMNFADYFAQNAWIQIAIFVLFILVGLFFLLRNSIPPPSIKGNLKVWSMPKFITGFLLAFLNPPVLIFWVLAFSFVHKYVLAVSDMSPMFTLLLFFVGVYAGKVVTLYFYGKWGKRIKGKEQVSGTKKNFFIGIALLLVGIVQGARFFI